MKNLIWLKYYTISENTYIFNIYNIISIILPKKIKLNFPSLSLEI